MNKFLTIYLTIGIIIIFILYNIGEPSVRKQSIFELIKNGWKLILCVILFWPLIPVIIIGTEMERRSFVNMSGNDVLKQLNKMELVKN